MANKVVRNKSVIPRLYDNPIRHCHIHNVIKQTRHCHTLAYSILIFALLRCVSVPVKKEFAGDAQATFAELLMFNVTKWHA